MIQAKNQQIKRSLDRLKLFSNHQDPKLSISAFYHIAQSLSKYANDCKENMINDQYFKLFYAQYQKFAKQDFSSLKSNHQKILDEIVAIVESKNFMQHLISDKKKLNRIRNSLQIRKSEIIQLTPEIYQFGKVFSNLVDNDQKQMSQNEDVQKSQSKESTQEDQNLQELQSFQEIKRLYQDHIIDEAYRKATQYLETVQDLKAISKDKVRLIQTINMEYETVVNLHKEFQSPGWVHDRYEDGITLQYKIYENQGAMAFKLEGEGQFPISPFLAIISQINLMEEYVPFCYGCKEMKDISRNQKIGTSKIYIPVLSDRQTYFYAAGYDRIKQNRSLFFFTKTITNDQIYQKKFNFKVPQQGEYVRLEYQFFIIEYQPINQKKAKIRLASKVDMKLNFVPQFIVFKSSRIFVMDYFKNILQKIKNFKGSPWQKKVEQNPNKYKFFDKKVSEYLLK